MHTQITRTTRTKKQEQKVIWNKEDYWSMFYKKTLFNYFDFKMSHLIQCCLPFLCEIHLQFLREKVLHCFFSAKKGWIKQ